MTFQVWVYVKIIKDDDEDQQTHEKMLITTDDLDGDIEDMVATDAKTMFRNAATHFATHGD